MKLVPVMFALLAVAPSCAGDELLDDASQTIDSNGVYQGHFTVSEPATVDYEIEDNYRNTPNNWSVAVVPASSVPAYLGGEDPVAYGVFEGRGSTGATMSLPAGDYALVLQCQNFSDPCRFDATVTADY